MANPLQGSSATLQGGTGISLGNSSNLLSAPGITVPKTAAKPNPVTTLQNDVNGNDAYIQNLLSSINSANQKVYAPKLDLAAINAQSRTAAENAVNPYYVKSLNDFLAQQGAVKQQQQTQYDTNIKNLQDTLKDTLAGNEINKGRTAEDAALKLADVNQTADRNQVDQGTQFDTARRGEAVDLAKAGLTTSGLGRQKALASETAHNLTEERQAQDIQTTKNQTELLKGRSLDDLLRSDELAKTSEGKGEKQAKFDLDTFIQNQGFDTENKKQSLEQERLGRVAQEQTSQAKLRVLNFINSISDPAQREAAFSTYGGAF